MKEYVIVFPTCRPNGSRFCRKITTHQTLASARDMAKKLFATGWYRFVEISARKATGERNSNEMRV